MAATPPSHPKSTGDDRNLVAVNADTAVTFEEKLNVFWQQNRMLVLVAVFAVLLAVLGKSLWDYLQRQKELEVEQAYATATTPEQLKSFAAAHPGHELAGIAHLRVADEAYGAGKSADALAEYDKAISELKTGPLVARAQLGRAVVKAQQGKSADATNDLKQLANDANQLKALREEAAYNLVSLAADAGNSADVQKYSELLQQIDGNPMSNSWLARAMSLRASLPAPKPAAVTPSPAPSATPASAPVSPKVELKLPPKK